MEILVNVDELVEFFGEGWASFDISSPEELREFLAKFCEKKIKNEVGNFERGY